MTVTKGHAGLPHSAPGLDEALAGLWRFAGDLCRFVHVYMYAVQMGRNPGRGVKPLRCFWGHDRAQ